MEAKLNKRKYESRGTFVPIFTEKLVDEILEKIEKMCPIDLICEAHNIAEQQFYEWIDQGKVDGSAGIKSLHAYLAESYAHLKCKRVMDALYDITNNAKGHQGQQWYLARAYWERFSEKVELIEIAKKLDKLQVKNKEGVSLHESNGKQMDSEGG